MGNTELVALAVVAGVLLYMGSQQRQQPQQPQQQGGPRGPNFGDVGGRLQRAGAAAFNAGTTQQALMTDLGFASAGAGLGGTLGTAVGAVAGMGVGSAAGAPIGGLVGTAAGAAAGGAVGFLTNGGRAAATAFFGG